MNEQRGPSEESKHQAAGVVSTPSLGLEGKLDLGTREQLTMWIAVALDVAWKRGLDDAKMEERLMVILGEASDEKRRQAARTEGRT